MKKKNADKYIIVNEAMNNIMNIVIEFNFEI